MSATTLAALLGSDTKARVMQTLYLHPDEAYHLRGLANTAGVDSGNAHKALRQLVDGHLVEALPDARGVLYRAERRSPLYGPLRQLFVASTSLVEDLQEVAQALRATQVAVFGSVAKGTDGPESDVDILVVGELSSIEAQAAFKPVGRKHGRKIQVVVVTPSRLAEHAKEDSPFWNDVFGHRLVTLKGEPLDASLR